MADLGKGVSYVYDGEGYNYDMVVFQKGKPPLDSELNLAQELQNIIGQRNLKSMSSGWLSIYPPYADKSLALTSSSDLVNKFYTQNPTDALPEYALINGQVMYVTNTGTTTDNANLIDLGTPPISGNRVNGVFLEMWRALITPSLLNNKPLPASVVDTFNDVYMIDENHGWICGTNGLILVTTNGGVSWPVVPVDTKRNLNGIHFYNSSLGWVVGDNGVIARSSSAGQTWSLLNSPTTIKLNSVYAASQTVVWAVGNSGVILKAFNGVSFVQMSSPTTVNLNRVYFSDTNHGWIVGDDGVILMTANGGVTWTQSSSGVTVDLNSIRFYNTNFGFAVGNGGTILRSSDGGVTWINQSNNVTGGAVTNNLYDVTLYPKLDEQVVNEEVSSQLGATGNSFVTMHKPITGVDRKGVVTNNPSDVTVTVNGIAVTVLSVNGSTGTVILAAAPGLGAVTKITYYYQASCAVFQGKAWAVGEKGKVLYTSDIGTTWTSQTSGTAYNVMAISFISQLVGWFVGAESIISYTVNSGTTWTSQESDISVRQVNRVYNEGNINTQVYLDENSIHPDAQIETSARVQVQYRVRVIEAVDPIANPEAGLSSSIMGFGPNSVGSFPYENMGDINGDFGCWRAQCTNTVDGYVYAIPMFFVARRNTNAYSSTSNPNGEHKPGTANIRPDLLLATNVVLADILDVRRKVVISSTGELFEKNFDALMSNTFETNLTRTTSSGVDVYGKEILMVNSVNAADVAAGIISSEGRLETIPTFVSLVSPLPPPTELDYSPYTSGIFVGDPSRFKAIYNSSNTAVNGKLIPGDFTNFGTIGTSFTFNNAALPFGTPGLVEYDLYGDFIGDSTSYLTYAPSYPQLSLSSGGTIYQGVLDTNASRVLESWNSNITGYQNYALVYSTQEAADDAQQHRASPVEVHYFMRIASDNLSSGVLSVPLNIVVDSSSLPYIIYTVSKIFNHTSEFSHKISNITFSSTHAQITPVAGYEFVLGTIIEVFASVESNASNLNVRNGAALNFNTRLRKVNNPVRSVIVDASSSNSYVIDYGSSAQILGWSSVDTTASLTQPVCWGLTSGNMIMTDTTRKNDLSRIQLLGPSGQNVRIQLTIKDLNLTGTMSVAYKYIPFQTQNLPASLIVDPVQISENIYISNLGSGGGRISSPYDLPLEHLPINGSLDDDKVFSNFIDLKLSNYFISTGFAKILAVKPASFNNTSITLSNPLEDNLGRTYFAQCSQELKFEGEGLQTPVARKVFIPVLARVGENTSAFMKNEYILLIFSRSVLTENENITGWYSGGNSAIAVYRLPNRPLSR
jgi:photosystem II stability/assembly factor-like uncharacterized protein